MEAATPFCCGFVGFWATSILLRGEEVWVSIATLVPLLIIARNMDVTYVDTEV